MPSESETEKDSAQSRQASSDIGDDIPASERKWTNIRHTAFRLTLEEDPSLAIPPKINSFAANGHTSPDQLRNTYLRYIDAERTASESRQIIRAGNWTMIRRAKDV